MNDRIFYRNGVLNLPDTVLNALPKADKLSLCVLLYLSKYPDDDRNTLCAKMRAQGVLCSETQFLRAQTFWKEQGILWEGEPDATEARPIQKNRQLPIYESQELAQKLTEGESAIGRLVDDCQRLAGKIFTPTDLSKIVALVDYVGLSCNYLRILYTYCVEKRDKRNIGFLQTTAQNLYDEGITEEKALITYLEEKEKAASFGGKLRTLFGVGERAFTAKEAKFVESWAQSGYDLELIRYAYDLTVDATGKASFAYLDKILQNWKDSGITDRKAATEAQEAYANAHANDRYGRSEAQKKPKKEKSFETDSFFAAALQRSYEKSQTKSEGDAK